MSARQTASVCWKQEFQKRFSGHSYVKLIKAGLCTNAIKEHALVYGAFATDKQAGKSPFSCSESQASDHIKSIYITNNPSLTCLSNTTYNSFRFFSYNWYYGQKQSCGGK